MKMERSRAYPFVKQVARRLLTICQPGKVVLAGSLRRGKQEVHDAELVVLPPYDTDLFGETLDTTTALDGLIEEMISEGILAWDMQVKRNGSRLKRLVAPALDNFVVELYLANPNNFGCIHLIRTGNAHFSKQMMTPQRWDGLMPNHY